MALIKRADSADVARRALVLDLGDLAAQGEAITVQARAHAEQIVRDSRTERQKLIGDARDKGHAEGLAKGHAEGLKRGREEGLAKALAEHRAALDKIEADWTSALGGFTAQRDRLLSDARREVVELALAIAAKVIKRAIESDPAIVEGQIGAVIELIARPSRLHLAVHPDDLARARETLPGTLRALGDSAHVELTADSSLHPGSVVVRTPSGGEVDASISTQLDRIAEALLPGRTAPSRGIRP